TNPIFKMQSPWVSDNTARKNAIRKDIARIKTILGERVSAAAAS
ncbi:MAG: 50S ribosomal protein L29, partial [Magnetovibrio sp.]|nr:50S ribosomal protein L29 [Magnetovibrio sp.]